ncbi:helix-turn-helix domain-containing protein [Faecalibaculum rodentium]|uniref:helix-turn-helix domain-containing protein n=1 Tax=Faecalibaculum rodentium TaxID=1702221 RepID=UPI0023F1ADB0|nr:helix-turn-helix transcriptional regulator [Faecalibaculum rodentium]
MPTTNFNEYFADQLKDPEFHQQFIEEKAILDSALAISEARHQAGLSQRQLSDRAGIPQSTIARVERGKNTSLATISKIASALGKSMKITFE